MKIALISYEFPPDTADGGVATYVGQAAAMLASRGHLVEVFAGSRERTETSTQDKIVVHRIKSGHGSEFRTRIGPIFAERHSIFPFDVMESPEWEADGAEAVHRVPDIPLVVRLHTPTYLIDQLSRLPTNHWKELKYINRTRFYLRGLRRGQRVPWLTGNECYVKSLDLSERALTHQADEIVTPSISLGKIVSKRWGIDPASVIHIPNLYSASEQMLSVPIETVTNRITFLGRLEMRKGVLDLARAIPLVLRRNPDAKFRFVGRPMLSPDPSLNMQQYLEKRLAKYEKSVEFYGSVMLPQIPQMLEETDICVFPSLWENFPNVCLESMSAGRGVIGSSAGGMLDMLEDGKYGLNVPPGRAFALSEAISALLSDPIRRQALGRAAREKVVTEYNLERIGILQEESYARAIARRHLVGTR